MKSFVLAPVLALSLLSQAQSLPAELSARIEVRSGRAEIVQQSSETKVLRKGESESFSGGAHLEVPAGAEVRIAYSGTASLSLWGPASIDWQDAQSGEPGTESIRWHLFQATWLDVEVRRGQHHLHLPGNWHARLEGGSMRLRGLSTGPLEMRLHAGQPVQLDWQGDVSMARPPLTIYPGSNIRLEQPVAAPVDRSSEGTEWKENEWSFRRNSETTEQQEERAARPEVLKEAPAWPLPEVPVVDPSEAKEPVHESEPSGYQPVGQLPMSPKGPSPWLESFDVETQAAAPLTLPIGQVTVEVLEDVPAVAAAPEKVSKPYIPSQWRGLQRSQLQDCGEIVVEQRKGVEVRVFAGGRSKVLIDRWDGRNTWVFTPESDLHLAPGAVCVFDDQGQLIMSHGTFETFPKVEGRPAWSEL